MATRRMFSIRLINSARFLKMPISSQALYFHLGLHADDDGVVEAYTVIKNIGCTEDDLRVLVTKGFVQVLNEDLVSYITDWNENNRIRADRKIDSMYKDLLISINPDVKLIEKRERADVKKQNGQPMDNQWTTNGQPMDGIGKVSIGKDSIIKKKNTKETRQAVIDSLIDDEEIKTELYDYIEMRKFIKSPITDRGLKILLNKLKSLSSNKDEQIQMIRNAIEGNWKSVYALKDKKPISNKPKAVEGEKRNYNMSELEKKLLRR